MVSFELNGKDVSVDVPEETPLLWVLRDELQMTGTKFGCGIAQCGACTVMMNGMTRRSCVTPVSMVDGASVTTIEGIDGPEAEALWETLRRPFYWDKTTHGHSAPDHAGADAPTGDP